MHVRLELSRWIGLTGSARVILIQYYFLVGYAHIAFNLLACAVSVSWSSKKVSVNTVFNLNFSSGAVLH